jgi:hypothetical protein
MSVRSKHSDYNGMHSRWELCEDFSEGEHAVHEEKEKYLPRLKDEEDASYKLRLSMTPVFNATWRTISGMRGMLFRKPPKVEVPAALSALFEDIDGSGTSMQAVAQEGVEEALTLGRVGILVDYPQAPEGITLADARVMQLRPMMCLYEAESIYNWAETRTNGRTTLTQVRLCEEILVPGEDEFTSKESKQYRVLDLFEGKYRQRVYTVNEKDEEVLVSTTVPMMNNKPLGFIPFVVVGVDSNGMDVDAPPLIDLVTTNLHHYMQATSYERGCFFSGLPTMFISGMEDSDGEISIGGSVANALGSPNAKAYYVEVASKFEALRTNLEDKKREMAVLGARMLEGGKNTGGVEAAETVARRQSGEESVLACMAQTASDGLTKALQWMADWMSASGPVSYQLNRDFLPQSMTAQDLTALVGAWQAGALSQEELFNNLKAGEIVSDSTDFETEQERINSAQAQLMAQQAELFPVTQPAGE